LRQIYGTVKWAVNGIFRQYTGWCGLNPKDLDPGLREDFHRVLAEAAGGIDRVTKRARKALGEGRYQLVLELTEVVLDIRPETSVAIALRSEALKRLGRATKNGVARNIYLTAAATLASGSVALKNSQRVGPMGCDGSKEIQRLGYKGQVQAVDAINGWYDRRMYLFPAQNFYSGSDFHNYGYWLSNTRTPREACENLMEQLLSFIPEKKGTILDVGCGKGATTRHLLNYYSPETITGINISEKQLQSCRLNAAGCNFLLMDATKLEFQDNYFEDVICVEAAMHFNTREKFLCETCRVLKPGGRLVLSDVLFKGPTRKGNTLVPTQNYLKNREEYRNLCIKSGFKEVVTIDATHECWGQFYRHVLSRLRNRLLIEEIDRPTFTRVLRNLVRRNSEMGSYVLVCARKSTGP